MQWLIKLRNQCGLNKAKRVTITKKQAEELVMLIGGNRSLFEDEVEIYKHWFDKGDLDVIFGKPICIDYNDLKLLKGLQVLMAFIASKMDRYKPTIVFLESSALVYHDIGKRPPPLKLSKLEKDFIKRWEQSNK